MAKILLFGVSTQKDRAVRVAAEKIGVDVTAVNRSCLLYTSPSPRDA